MLRIVSYNVHSCVGTDGRLCPRRIADLIAELEPDVVALQELDVRRNRTGGIDQAQEIAELLSMSMHFHPALRVMEEEYGEAILASAPSRLIRAGALPGAQGFEPRGALRVAISSPEGEFDVINTHLGLRHRDRTRQAEALAGPDWIGARPERPLLLVGDFNIGMRSRVYRLLTRSQHRQCAVPIGRQRTFPSRFPLFSIDHIVPLRGIRILKRATVTSPAARLASDHLPVFADFECLDCSDDFG